MIIDTHCHLIDDAFTDDVDEVVLRARQAGVEKMVLACCDETELPAMLGLCTRYPDVLFPSVGIHPENMADNVPAQLERLKQTAGASAVRFCAVGEIGLDLHWDTSRLDQQLWLLRAQVDWALDLDLPVLLHIRDAMPQFLELLRNELAPLASAKQKRLRGILHCYSGTADQAREALQHGNFLLGVGGTLTYKKSVVPEVVQAFGLDRLVLETDAPYLAPVPKRGRRNEPAFTAFTCQALANVLGKRTEEVAETTTRNARQLFGF